MLGLIMTYDEHLSRRLVVMVRDDNVASPEAQGIHDIEHEPEQSSAERQVATFANTLATGGIQMAPVPVKND